MNLALYQDQLNKMLGLLDDEIDAQFGKFDETQMDINAIRRIVKEADLRIISRIKTMQQKPSIDAEMYGAINQLIARVGEEIGKRLKRFADSISDKNKREEIEEICQTEIEMTTENTSEQEDEEFCSPILSEQMQEIEDLIDLDSIPSIVGQPKLGDVEITEEELKMLLGNLPSKGDAETDAELNDTALFEEIGKEIVTNSEETEGLKQQVVESEQQKMSEEDPFKVIEKVLTEGQKRIMMARIVEMIGEAVGMTGNRGEERKEGANIEEAEEAETKRKELAEKAQLRRKAKEYIKERPVIEWEGEKFSDLSSRMAIAEFILTGKLGSDKLLTAIGGNIFSMKQDGKMIKLEYGKGCKNPFETTMNKGNGRKSEQEEIEHGN